MRPRAVVVHVSGSIAPVAVRLSWRVVQQTFTFAFGASSHDFTPDASGGSDAAALAWGAA